MCSLFFAKCSADNVDAILIHRCVDSPLTLLLLTEVSLSFKKKLADFVLRFCFLLQNDLNVSTQFCFLKSYLLIMGKKYRRGMGTKSQQIVGNFAIYSSFPFFYELGNCVLVVDDASANEDNLDVLHC